MIDPEAYYLALKKDNTMYFAAAEDTDQLRRYEDGIYVPNGVAAIRKKIMRMTHGAGVSKHVVGEIVALTTWDNYVDRDAFDTNPDIINMANGLYNIETGLSPHTPKYLSLHKSPIIYDPDATCSLIDDFIEEVVPKAYIPTIYEIGGYAMAARKNLKRAFTFVGDPNSGKSVMISLLWQLIGAAATTDVSPLTVSNTTYGAAEYYGKQLNLVDDLGDAPITNTGVLKSVISSSRINAQFKYGQPFDFIPNVLCVFATNHVPKVEPFDDAFASRFDIVEFPNQFEGTDADPNLISKLTTPSEMSGFFNKCIDGLRRLMARKAFSNESSIADRVTAYKHHASPVEQFIDEACVLDDLDAYVMKDTLYRAYTAWSEDHGYRTEQMKDLTIALTQRGCVIRLVMNDDDERKRAYIGVHFKHDIGDFA